MSTFVTLMPCFGSTFKRRREVPPAQRAAGCTVAQRPDPLER